jgi:hypothetical protein
LDIRIPAHLYKIYHILFDSESKIGLAEISVFTYHFAHNQDKVDISDTPNYYIDDDSNMLLDDDGNIIIEEDTMEGSDIDVI